MEVPPPVQDSAVSMEESNWVGQQMPTPKNLEIFFQQPQWSVHIVYTESARRSVCKNARVH